MEMRNNVYENETNFIAFVQKSIINKETIYYVKASKTGDKVLSIVNGMDKGIVKHYITSYCLEYINSIKGSTRKIGHNKTNLSYRVLNLIMPNMNYKRQPRRFIIHEEIKKFVANINNVIDDIKYSIFDSLIIEKKYIKDLNGDLFNMQDILRFTSKYIEDKRGEFTEYIDFLLKIELEKRFREKRQLKANTEINTIISVALVGHKRLCDLMKTEYLYDLMQERYTLYCEKVIREYIRDNKPISDISHYILTEGKILDVFSDLEDEVKNQYIDYWSNYYLSQKKEMRYYNFQSILGITNLNPANIEKKRKYKIDYIKNRIDTQHSIHAKKLLEANRGEVSFDNDKWVVSFQDGPSLKYRRFDFAKIESCEFRYEVKLYMMNEIRTKDIKNVNTLSLVTECCNFLYRRRKTCSSFAFIEAGDIEALNTYLQNDLKVKGRYGSTKRRSVNTVRKMIGKLNIITDYLMKYSKKNKLKTSVPLVNVLSGVKFRNSENMTKRTEIIPDIVLEQLEHYKMELRPEYQLIYEIFNETGLRLKSVMKLKSDCLKYSRYENVRILKYKPFKVDNKKKKMGEEPYEELIISEELANKIQIQIDKTKDLGEQNELEEIFIEIHKKAGKTRVTLYSGSGFVDAVNRLINKHNIVDYDGVLWNFKSRQFRKTLVALMKENGATDAEIIYVLGHNSNRTLNKYYKEINEQRIEELNHEFFKKRFDIDVGEKYLSQFSDEEKKCLYIDFVMNYRRVPLGYCGRHIKEGGCNGGCGAGACEKCGKIITGRRFLSDWIKLRDDRQREINELKEYYTEYNISPDVYEEYKEYRSLAYDFNLYQDGINKIKGE